MKKNKLILSLSAAITSATLLAPVATLVTSCSKKTNANDVEFALLRTSAGYCIDSIVNADRTSITELVVPEEIDGIPVVEISKGAFKGVTNLQSITLPFIGRTKNAIGKAGLFGYIFGDEMWEGCGAYTWQNYTTSDQFDDEPDEFAQFAIPAAIRTVTVTSASLISPGAFSNCRFIKNIYFKQDTNSTTVTEIGNYAFQNCLSLKTFEIPSTVKVVGKEAFNGCTNLKKIELPSSVTTVKHRAFANCICAQSASIPSSVTTMGKLVFENFSSGLVMVEAETIPEGWDSQWVTHDISVVYGYSSGGIYYVDKGVVAVCGSSSDKYAYMVSWQWSSTDTEITIPGTVTCGDNVYPIKKIGPNIFYDHTTLETITISENVEVLGANCFTNCTSLKSVTFPDTLKEIGQNCFLNCTALSTIDFNKVTTICASAFEGDTGLTSIDLGDAMETIGSSAFKNCTYLNPCREIDSTTGEVTKHPLTFPKTIKSIGDYAFYGIAKYRDASTTNNYSDMIFEADNENTVEFGNYAFAESGVRSTSTEYPTQTVMAIDFNNIKVDKFGDYCFQNLYIYDMYSFPQTVTEIGNYAFYNTTPVYMASTRAETDRTFTLPATVTKVGDYGFYNCYNCRFVIPEDSQLKTIGKHAFRYCSYTPSDTSKACFANLEIPNTVETIGEYAFQGCSGMRKVKLPSNSKFTRLENYTFSSCTNLGADQDVDAPDPIVVPDTVTYLGSNVFSSCKNLKAIKIAGPITYLGSSCFAGCESIEHGKTITGGTLQSLVFSDNFKHLTTFGSNMYQGCKKLVWAPFPTNDSETAFTSVTSIPSTCFSDCDKLSNFEILSNITSIGNAAFRNCSSMTEVTGMDSVKVINANAFYGCSGLTKFTMPDGCYSIGDNAFVNCTGLGKTNDFVLPTNITQAWTTSTNKGMGQTPFTGWTADQTIKIKKASIVNYVAATDLETRWGWELEYHAPSANADAYYTCEASGSSVVHFTVID